MATALTAERDIQWRQLNNAELYEPLVDVGDTIYKGSLVFVMSSGEATADIADAIACLGVAMNTVSGATGTERVKVRTGCDALLPCENDLTAADLFLNTVYANNDDTVEQSTAGGIKVGVVTDIVSATKVWVRLQTGILALSSTGATGPTGPTGPTG